MWPTQTWFTGALEIVIVQPIIRSRHLQLSGPKKRHPLHTILTLLALLCSREKEYQADSRKN